MSALATLQAAFRDAAARVEPGSAAPASPELLQAYLVLHRVRKHVHYLDAAAALVPSAQPTPAWLAVLCDGWVVRASAGFREAAEAIADAVPDSAAAVPALLRHWRITGRAASFDRAAALAPDWPSTPDEAAAAWAMWRATADEAWRARATDALADATFATLPLRHWPMLADLRDLPRGPREAADALESAPDDAAARVFPLAAVALPVLQIEVRWYLPTELAEGPMAEAATFVWPALRLRFARLPIRDQIRFGATLDGEERGELEDAGIVGPWMESLVEELDHGALIGEVKRRRRGGSRLRRR